MAKQAEVVSLSSAKKDSTNVYTLVDFPSPSAGDRLPLKDFLNITPFPANRDVARRARTLTRKLKDSGPMHKHNEVDIMRYTGPTIYSPAFFQTGTDYVINANTRQHIWASYLKGVLTHNKVTHLELPKEVIPSYYEFDNAESAIAFYYTIDSAESYEKPAEKITGAYRAHNILNNLTNRKIKGGAVTVALNTACPYRQGTWTVPGVDDLLAQVGVMRDVIQAIDKLNAVKGVFSTQLSLGVAMLAGKIMGVDHPDWIQSVELLNDEELFDNTYGLDEDAMEMGLEDDGVDFLWRGLRMNPMAPADGMDNALPYNMGLYNDRKNSLDYIAHCWTNIIDGEKMFEPPIKSDIANAYQKLLSRCWPENDTEE